MVSAAEIEDNLIRFPYSETVTGPPIENPESTAVPEWRQQLRERVRESRERRGLTIEDQSASAHSVPPDRHDRPASLEETLADRNPIVESALNRIKRATSAVTPLPLTNRTSTSGTGRSSAVKALEPERKAPTLPLTEPARPLLKKTTAENVRSVASPGEERVPAMPTGAGASSVRREKLRPKASDTVESGLISNTDYTTEVSQPTSTASVKQHTDSGKSGEPLTLQSEKAVVELPTVVPAPVVAPDESLVSGPAIQPASPDDSELKSEAPLAPEPPPAPKPAPRRLRTTGKLRPEELPVATQIIEVPQVFGSAAVNRGLPATFWVRSLAGGCDFEIISLSFLPIFASYAILNTVLESETLLLMIILLAGLAFIYFTVTLLVAGRTFGMAMLNLRLVPLSGDKDGVTRQQRLLRAWASTIAFLCPPLNLLVRALTAQNLSLPDLVSKTLPVEN
jgi:uncharacterized RDD family membrane protein YckC